MAARREVIDAQGYLHAIGHSSTLGGQMGYLCTCGAWRVIDDFDSHLDEVGVKDAPGLPPIDAGTRARAIAAGRVCAGVHNSAALDLDGFVLCKCGIPFTTWIDWGDHYADQVLTAALTEISTR